MTAVICFICEESPKEDEKVMTVMKKGLRTLISASIIREDNKRHKYKLQKKGCVIIHKKCWMSYISCDNLRACRRRIIEQIGNTTACDTPSDFEFQKDCLFCGKKITEISLNDHAQEGDASEQNQVKDVATLALHRTIWTRACERTDELGRAVLNRVNSVSNLVEVKARYHSPCYLDFFRPAPELVPDRSSQDVPPVGKLIERFAKDHPDKRNFSLKQIIDNYESQVATDRRLKKKLYERAADDVIITLKEGSEPIIHLRDKILSSKSKDSVNEKSDRAEIIRAAAKIIAEDIQAREYDAQTYPSPDSFLKNVEEVIPNSLRVFLDSLVLSDKRETESGNLLSKIIGIAHAVISCVQPQSFVSSIKIGLGAVLKKKFGSITLLDILSSLGFCASYDEALLFEVSVLNEPNNALLWNNCFHNSLFGLIDHDHDCPLEDYCEEIECEFRGEEISSNCDPQGPNKRKI